MSLDMRSTPCCHAQSINICLVSGVSAAVEAMCSEMHEFTDLAGAHAYPRAEG